MWDQKLAQTRFNFLMPSRTIGVMHTNETCSEDMTGVRRTPQDRDIRVTDLNAMNIQMMGPSRRVQKPRNSFSPVSQQQIINGSARIASTFYNVSIFMKSPARTIYDAGAVKKQF